MASPRRQTGGDPTQARLHDARLATLATILACESPPAPGEGAQQEGSAMPEPTPIEHIVPEGVARLPVFTPAVRVGDLVFLSGAIGTPLPAANCASWRRRRRRNARNHGQHRPHP